MKSFILFAVLALIGMTTFDVPDAEAFGGGRGARQERRQERRAARQERRHARHGH